MSNIQQVITILIATLGTMLTRFISFIAFPEGKKTPKFIEYLGKVLPPAVLGMLVIYCYKSLDFSSATHGIPEIVAGVFVVLIHKWKNNMFLSIVLGIALYMVLIRVM